MPAIYDFDARRKSRREARAITLFGRTYDQMPDLPYEIGLDWLFFTDDVKDMTAQEFRTHLTDLNRRTIDAAFGAGRFDEWTDPENPYAASNDDIKDIVRYIRSGYIYEALEGELPNAPAGATSEMSSEDTSAPSTATSGAATASDSGITPPA